MADNIQIPASGTGTATPTIATDDVGGAHHQRMKLVDGTDASSTAVKATSEGGLYAGVGPGYVRKSAQFSITGASTAAEIDCSGGGTLIVDWTGTFTGLTGTFEADMGNGNWLTAHTYQIYDLSNNNNFVSFNSIGSVRRMVCSVAGAQKMRMNVSAVSSGTCVVDYTVQAQPYPMQQPNQQITHSNSTARTATTNLGTISNYYNRGAMIIWDVTAAGTGNQTISVENKDQTSAKFYTLLSGSAVTTISTNTYWVYPGATPVANVAADRPTGRTFRCTITANNANSMTSSIGVDAMV